jgi:hypothetical protein
VQHGGWSTAQAFPDMGGAICLARFARRAKQPRATTQQIHVSPLLPLGKALFRHQLSASPMQVSLPFSLSVPSRGPDTSLSMPPLSQSTRTSTASCRRTELSLSTSTCARTELSLLRAERKWWDLTPRERRHRSDDRSPSSRRNTYPLSPHKHIFVISRVPPRPAHPRHWFPTKTG